MTTDVAPPVSECQYTIVRTRKKRSRSRQVSVLPQNRKGFDSGQGQIENRRAWNDFKQQIVHYGATSSSIPQLQFIAGGTWRLVVQSLEMMFERHGLFQRNADSLSVGGEE